jgi:dolichol-phosphate mannosyltransferase
MAKHLVVIPTYNERENIVRLTPEVLAQGPEFHILIVDDNSPDGTGRVADELAAHSQGRVHVLHRSGKLGLGTAYLEGFRFGLEHGYDFIFEMDADFSHQPRYLPDLLAAARRTGVAVGSRLAGGGGVENWPWYRKLISRGGSSYSRAVLGLKVQDCTSGFKCFSRAALQVLNLPSQVRSTGFGFQVEVNCLAEWCGYEVVEVPIIFPDRVSGQSKMSKKIFIEALVMVWRLRASKVERLRSILAGFVYPPAGEHTLSAADGGERVGWRVS